MSAQLGENDVNNVEKLFDKSFLAELISQHIRLDRVRRAVEFKYEQRSEHMRSCINPP